MSIEASSTATAKAAAGAASHSGKGKATSGGEADALAAGGFLALMASFEPEIVVAGGGPGGPLSGDQMLAADAPPLTDANLQLVPTATAVPLLPVEPDPPKDLTMLLAQAGEVAVDKPISFSDQRATVAKGGLRLDTPAVGPEKPGAVLAGPAPLATDTLADFRRGADSLPEQAIHGTQARSSKTRGTELRLEAGAILEESRALSRVSTPDFVAREPTLSGALLASGLGEGFLRQGDRVAGKSAFSAAGSGVEGIWGQQAFLAENRVATSSVMATTAAPSLESQVADTVSYWVTQGVKHAELKLDGFGKEPLEVSISLQGGEAHIDFRTDLPEVRKILEGATAHLKELLKSEGLVLSGVSVGTSGQNGDAAGAQERRNRSNARQATISTTQTGPAETLPRTAQSTGRAVDLFV